MNKILSVVWYKVLPSRYGGQKGIVLFTKYLASLHKVVFLCSKNNEPDASMPFEVKAELPVIKSQFANPFCWKKIIGVARKIQPSFIIVEHPYHGIAGVRSARTTGAKLIVHAHNIESQRFREMGKWWWRFLAKYEAWTFKKAHLVLFKTEVDLHWAVEHYRMDLTKGFIVPYGIEKNSAPDRIKARTMIGERYGLAEHEKILLFAGSLDYDPNARAVELIFKEIAPRLWQQKKYSFRILICGRNHLKRFQHLKGLNHPGVLYAGEVNDIETYFGGADLFLTPVYTGGGIQTKIVEAIRYNLNVVCLKEQVDENLISLAHEKLFLSSRNDHDVMVKNIFSALEKNCNTPQVFFDYYDWSNIVSRLNEKLNES